ncbi:MAG: MoxR family ATPase [Candidatus Wallbacteria bacterium]|nr:MoxR family ATPase [Candidatus Wallbacteria bacterium]
MSSPFSQTSATTSSSSSTPDAGSPPVTSGRVGSTSAPGADPVRQLEESIERIIVGKRQVVRLTIAALLARGHVLIEDVPGVGKTTLAHALARSLDCSFQRIQFTNDLLPSDIVGVSVFDSKTGEFSFKPGPLFANVVLADEINRTTPKTQSCLLEAMNEAQVSVDGRTYALPKPFLIIATQNPVEYHGTFPLPESQMDRFMVRLRMGYPSSADERRILTSGNPALSVMQMDSVLHGADIIQIQNRVETVRVDGSIVDYLLRLVEVTRSSPLIELGISPRGALALYRLCQAFALVEGRDYCIPDDVKQLALPALAHRLILSSKVNPTGRGGMQAGEILGELMDSVPVPV